MRKLRDVLSFDSLASSVPATNKILLVISLVACMGANVYLYRLCETQKRRIKTVVNINSAVFEHIRAANEMEHVVSDNTVRISHYTNGHEPLKSGGPLNYCPECHDICRHEDKNYKDIVGIPREHPSTVPSKEAVNVIRFANENFGIANDPRVTPTDLQLLVSDSIEFARMTDRIRQILFTIDCIQKRNLKECREMFGTDYLERD